MKKQAKIILALSLPLVILVAITSATGIFTPQFYARETWDWQLQSRGQDLVDLYIVVPALIITCCLVLRGSIIAELLWAGIVSYLLYSYLIYCFSVHFNKMFIFYCWVLGISFYSLFWMIQFRLKQLTVSIIRLVPFRITGYFFIVLSLLFYFLWLSEILPSIFSGTIPANLEKTGLPSNPVHVIDLSVFLPAILITGFLLLKRNQTAFFFGIMLLAFFILMNVTIGWLAFLMYQQNLESSLSVVVIMGVLIGISLMLLVWNIRSVKIKST